MSDKLTQVVTAQKQGHKRGITSICSAHPWVLKAAMQGVDDLLVESTCNQVNQFGGYTGMTPDSFASFIRNLAEECGYPASKLIMGGDHLGPNPWQHEPAGLAMRKAEDLVQACVKAGYTKIHLDTSMRLSDDDPSAILPLEVNALRTARLLKAAECASSEVGTSSMVRYVIGTEVPPPGGAYDHEDSLSVTEVKHVEQMLEVMQASLVSEGLQAAWEKVIAIVVQPGVEFGNDFILDYQPEKAQRLARFIETTPFVFEAHSTDYQTAESLTNLVRDHFAILKVGPALTYAFRQAAFALTMVENELIPQDQRSLLIERLDQAMLRDPSHWKSHYHGTAQEIAFARKYSLSDRVRYYWAQPDVQASLNILLKNLDDKALPLSLLSQYFPHLLLKVREGRLENSARSILLESVSAILRDYDLACAG